MSANNTLRARKKEAYANRVYSREFLSLGRREIIGRFDGGRLTSDGGGLLLREVDARIGLMERVAGCFKDYRNPES